MIRTATMNDINEIAQIEATCFPIAEAATREAFVHRLQNYPNHFWVLEKEGMIIGFVNGMVTDERELLDEMYEDATLHDEGGAWQMIFGVNTLPSYRRKGYAQLLLQKVIEDARIQNRVGIVLTCKSELVHYYAKLGFIDEGISNSNHGGVVWHKMRLTF